MKCAASFAVFLGLTAMALAASSSIEFRGVTVGKSIKLLSPMAGENYHDLKLAVGNEAVSVVTAAGETVTFSASKASTFYQGGAGESLAQIAQATGSSVERLIELNEMTDPTMVKVGQVWRTK